jgi:hypothetical protein
VETVRIAELVWQFCIDSDDDMSLGFKLSADHSLVHLNLNYMSAKAAALPRISQPVSYILTLGKMTLRDA